MELYTPETFVAGTRPFGQQDPAEVAWHAAAAGLDTEQVRMIVSVTLGRVWFLAAPAREFASVPECGSSLSAALPGMPEHRGNGTYLLPLEPLPLWAAVRVQDDQIRSFTGSLEDARRFGEGLPMHDIRDAKASRWHGYHEQRLAAERASLRRAFRWGSGMATAGFLLWAGAASLGVFADRQHNAAATALRERITSMTQYANQMVEQPLARTLADLQRVSQVAVQSGGAIQKFQATQGQVAWRMRLPNWVNGSAYAGLGPGIDARPAAGGMIDVSKGDLR